MQAVATRSRAIAHHHEHFPDVSFLAEEKAKGVQVGRGNSAFIVIPTMEAAQRRRKALLNILIEESTGLKDRILDLHRRRGLRSVVFASAHRGVGVWSVVMNLVKTFEKTESMPILVMDANFKSPGVSSYLGPRGLGKGLLDLLENPQAREGVLQKVQDASVYFMSHGRKRRHAAELLQPERVERVLNEMSNLFDLILIDAPPLRDFPDGFLWGRLTDGMILVSHPQRTTMDDVRFVQAEAKQHKIEILGNVLNRRKYNIPRFIYEWF